MGRKPAATAGIGLGKRLRLAHMAFSRAFRIELGREDVTFSQFVHLERLWEEDGLSQAELSRRVGVETASSTSVIGELERLKLIKRKRSTVDRRKIHVFLTPRGTEIKPQLLAAAKRVNMCAGRGRSRQDLTRIFADLDEIAQKLAGAYGSAAPAANHLD